MQITKIQVKNFRLLRDTKLDIKKDLSLLIGKNNSGKTSLIALTEKFFNNSKFNLDDFSLKVRAEILDLDKNTLEANLAIQLIIEIQYDSKDDLSVLSDFILDLDPSVNTVRLLFECAIDKALLLRDVGERKDKQNYISKNISKYLDSKLYVFQEEKDLDWNVGRKLVLKELSDLKKLITFQVIHAKRNVSSSEESSRDRYALSSLTTKFYKSNDETTTPLFDDINQRMIALDKELDVEYKKAFDPFLGNAKKFLQLKNLKVISDVQSKGLIANASQVVYGDDEHVLPEHLNGLGFMNILYLLLEMEINKEKFLKASTPLNILFI